MGVSKGVVFGLLVSCLVLAEAFSSSDAVCKFLCESGGHCPKSCQRNVGSWSKRSVRDYRFDGYSFDDYLFMKLLGRDPHG